MLIVMLEYLRARLRRLGVLGGLAAVFVGLYVELPLAEKVIAQKERSIVALLMAPAERSLAELAHHQATGVRSSRSR